MLFWKKIFWQNHQNLCWILAPFLLEAVEDVWGQKSFKWWIKHKFPLLRTSESSRFLNSIIWGLYFDFWKKKSSNRILKTRVEFYHLFCRRPLRLCEVKKVSNDGSGINFHNSGSHWASVFGRFVKTSGQARSLLCVNS